ncbi:MAG: creatininase family protein [Planctomycetes bacterium]|nr:creatininase family protein [Planctomycetota bacterium]
MKYRYDEFTWPEIKEAVRQEKVVVLPVGTVEQHGPHLPLAVDNLTSGELSRRAVERVPEEAVLMPQVSYGFNEHHLDFPGTIAISHEHFVGFIVDIGRSLAHHGFRKLLVINGHGSNIPFLEVACRRICNTTPAIAAIAAWWNLAKPAIREIRESPKPGGMSHGCELETSVILHLRPDLVQMDKAVKDIHFQPSKFIWWDLEEGSPVRFMEHFSRMSKTGVIGDATLATEEKGRKVVEYTVDRLVELIREFRRRRIDPQVDHH